MSEDFLKEAPAEDRERPKARFCGAECPEFRDAGDNTSRGSCHCFGFTLVCYEGNMCHGQGKYAADPKLAAPINAFFPHLWDKN
jgi:hypothetical protein